VIKPPPKQCIVKSKEFYQSIFQQTLDFPSYKEFASHTPIVGIWDDHDYGRDNAGSEWCGKDLVREIYLDFIVEATDSARRIETGTGLYQDYFIRKEVDGKELLLHLILLDNRYNYNKRTKDILGDD
jgi:alkaline phosphatase D